MSFLSKEETLTRELHPDEIILHKERDLRFCRNCQKDCPIKIKLTYKYWHVLGLPLFMRITYFSRTCIECGQCLFSMAGFKGIGMRSPNDPHCLVDFKDNGPIPFSIMPWPVRHIPTFLWIVATTILILINHFLLNQHFPMGWIIIFTLSIRVIIYLFKSTRLGIHHKEGQLTVRTSDMGGLFASLILCGLWIAFLAFCFSAIQLFLDYRTDIVFNFW